MCVIVTVAVPGGTSRTLLVIGPVHVPLKENGGGGGGVGVGAVGDELPPPHAAVIHSAKTAMLRWIRILEVIPSHVVVLDGEGELIGPHVRRQTCLHYLATYVRRTGSETSKNLSYGHILFGQTARPVPRSIARAARGKHGRAHAWSAAAVTRRADAKRRWRRAPVRLGDGRGRKTPRGRCSALVEVHTRQADCTDGWPR